MLACPNAEFMLCLTTVIAPGQGVIQAHFGRHTCKESDAIAQGRQFILEHRCEVSPSRSPPTMQLSCQGCLLLPRNPNFKAVVN